MSGVNFKYFISVRKTGVKVNYIQQNYNFF
jgi:hypothetical protein